MLSKIIVVWAAVGVVLTGATQLRLAGQPIGPGELVLVLWVAFVGFCLLRGVRFAYTDGFKVFLVFWLVAAFLLALGSLLAIHINRLADRTAGHDTQAFLFVGVLTCLLAIRIGNVSYEAYYLSLARATFFAVTAAGLALLAAGLVTTQLGPISLWYFGVRFRGWSENPNQLALFMLPMPFLGWYLIQHTQSLMRKVVYLLAILICAATGIATESDALRVAWAGALGATLAILWSQVVFRGRSRFLHISHVVLPLLVIALAIGTGTEIAAYVEEIASEIYERGGQGENRITNWLNGIDAMIYHPLGVVVGLGPGAHSGKYRAFEGLEAHNTFVDWATCTGLLGLLLLLSLLLWCMNRALHARAFWLFAIVVVISIDGLFGNSLRQPVFWMFLVLVVGLTQDMEMRASEIVRQPHPTPGEARTST